LSSRLLSKNIKIRIYRSIIFPVVLYGCETWSLTLREEYRLRVFENRVLRRIFRPKKDEVTGNWRKLHNEGLHNLYSSPNIIRMIKSRRMKWAGHVTRIREKRNARRWVDNIKIDLREIGWDGADRVDLAHDSDQWRALVNTVMNLRVP
jgi:hypothetical protein